MDMGESNPAAPAAFMTERAAIVHAARARCTATGWTSIPVTASRRRFRISLGSQSAASAVSMKWDTASATKVPEPQAGSNTALSQRVGHQLPDHGSGQPSRCVVFAQLVAFLRWYDSLIKVGGGVWRCFGPFEPSDSSGYGFHQGVTARLIGPGEEIRF